MFINYVNNKNKSDFELVIFENKKRLKEIKFSQKSYLFKNIFNTICLLDEIDEINNSNMPDNVKQKRIEELSSLTEIKKRKIGSPEEEEKKEG